MNLNCINFKKAIILLVVLNITNSVKANKNRSKEDFWPDEDSKGSESDSNAPEVPKPPPKLPPKNDPKEHGASENLKPPGTLPDGRGNAPGGRGKPTEPESKVQRPPYLKFQKKLIEWERKLKKPKWATWLNESQWESHKNALDDTIFKIFDLMDNVRQMVGLKPANVLNDEYYQKKMEEQQKNMPHPDGPRLPDNEPGHSIPTKPQSKGGAVNQLVISGIWVLQNAANSVKTFLPQTIQDMWTLSVKALGFAQTTESLQPLAIAGTKYSGPQSNYVEDYKR